MKMSEFFDNVSGLDFRAGFRSCVVNDVVGLLLLVHRRELKAFSSPKFSRAPPSPSGAPDTEREGRGDVNHLVAEGVRSRLEEQRSVQDHPAPGAPHLPPDLPENLGMHPAVQARDGFLRPEGEARQRGAVHPTSEKDALSPVPGQRGADSGEAEHLMPEDIRIDAPGALIPKDRGDGTFPAADASGQTDHEAFHRRRIVVSFWGWSLGGSNWGTSTPSEVYSRGEGESTGKPLKEPAL